MKEDHSKIRARVLQDNIGLADYENERFGISITISTVYENNERNTDLVEYNCIPEPISYLDLLLLVPHMYEALYKQGAGIHKLIKGDDSGDILEAGSNLRREREIVAYLGDAFESLTEFTDSLLLEFDDEGNIENRG